MSKLIKSYGLYAIWTIALVATLGSLYFSEILKFPPCVLCWYQRIAMYPIVVIFLIGILRQDTKAYLYAWPLAFAGWLVSIYHNLLYYNIIPEAIVPCINGVSCTTKQVEWFGVITIPLLSLVGFTIINILLIAYHKSQTYEERT